MKGSENEKLFRLMLRPRFASSARSETSAVTSGMLSIQPNVETATVSAPYENPRPSGIIPSPMPSSRNETLIIRVRGVGADPLHKEHLQQHDQDGVDRIELPNPVLGQAVDVAHGDRESRQDMDENNAPLGTSFLRPA